ncbi:MAG: bacillithiol biosynthesis cysteine-adding enzyme BshC [Anaerolineae bacterium]|jgi:bacillithiol biosynthesis cysteine-adding enzyme BshC|nr:bacillithiol biosynthesis cysteine-adding enzyme BshC [Chloroflexota bacterium]
MIDLIQWNKVPAMAGNRLFLDYVDGQQRALAYYTQGPRDFYAALEARRNHPYPRAGLAQCLAEYNQRLGASPQTMENIAALARPDAFCVVGGQQAGFMGGPAYVAYKIDCTIQLARRLADTLGVTVVPVFWLASEDHDFGEINHAHVVQPDGEIGRVSFDWNEKGRPIADLSITDAVREAVAAYWRTGRPGPDADRVRSLTEPRGSRYCDWLAALWLQLFAQDGLVVLEPATVRPLAGELFSSALSQRDKIGSQLKAVAERLTVDGYTPLLDPETAGTLYTFEADGRRVRVSDPVAAASEAATHPERFSTDAALRPLLADSTLPVLASTLGAGELAYQGMLRPLYEQFGIPQPVCYPRASYTILSAAEQERLAAYGLHPLDVLSHEVEIDSTMRRLMPAAELERFARAREGVGEALNPLRGYLEELDPNLVKSWEQGLASAVRNIDKMEERAINVTLSRGGYSRRELQALRNMMLPRGRLQERVLPVTHMLQHYGMGFLSQLRAVGEPEAFGHAIVTLEELHA